MIRKVEKSIYHLLPSIIMAVILLGSCKQKMTDTHREDAIELYRKSLAMMKLYIDSFYHAPDSTTLLEMEERFTHDLTALNFKYPSETCLEISEGENDTLTNLTEKMVSLRDSLLYIYAHPVVSVDSITLDSIN